MSHHIRFKCEYAWKCYYERVGLSFLITLSQKKIRVVLSSIIRGIFLKEIEKLKSNIDKMKQMEEIDSFADWQSL